LYKPNLLRRPFLTPTNGDTALLYLGQTALQQPFTSSNAFLDKRFALYWTDFVTCDGLSTVLFAYARCLFAVISGGQREKDLLREKNAINDVNHVGATITCITLGSFGYLAGATIYISLLRKRWCFCYWLWAQVICLRDDIPTNAVVKNLDV